MPANENPLLPLYAEEVRKVLEQYRNASSQEEKLTLEARYKKDFFQNCATLEKQLTEAQTALNDMQAKSTAARNQEVNEDTNFGLFSIGVFCIFGQLLQLYSSFTVTSNVR